MTGEAAFPCLIPINHSKKTDPSRRLVRVTGLEPARPFDHQPLKLARLPFRHTRVGDGLGS